MLIAINTRNKQLRHKFAWEGFWIIQKRMRCIYQYLLFKRNIKEDFFSILRKTNILYLRFKERKKRSKKHYVVI